MLKIILFSTFIFSQSYSDKPDVPVFYDQGRDVVRVDCWDSENVMTSHLLAKTDHPAVFRKTVYSNAENHFALEVNLLKAENTLRVEYKEGQKAPLEVMTYGLECGFRRGNQSVYCSIFDGETYEN